MSEKRDKVLNTVLYDTGNGYVDTMAASKSDNLIANTKPRQQTVLKT